MLEQEPARALPGQAPLALVELPARRRGALLLAFALLVPLLGGCAGVAEVTGAATQEDVGRLRADLSALQQTAKRAQVEAETLSKNLDRRLREGATERERQSAALAQRLDGLAATLTALAKRVDELGARVDALSRQLRAAAAPPKPAPATPPAPASPPGPVAAPARPTTGALQPQDIYQAAYIDFSKGSYSLAIAGFREFIRRYPEHELANAAQYWIGETYFSLARGYANAGQADRATELLEQAVQEFKKVVADYPRGSKAPTAIYKEALALIELKQPALAEARLQYLIDNFPQAEESRLARERLGSMPRR